MKENELVWKWQWILFCRPGWPNLIRRMQGKQLELSVIQVFRVYSLHHIASNMPWSGCLVWPLRPGPLPAAQRGGGALPLLQLRLLSSAKVLGKWSASKAQKGGSQIFSNKVTHPIPYFLGIHHLQLRFSGSAHVQHLRKHPKKYEAAVVEFLKRTMSVVEEEEEVGSWIAWLNLGISPKVG